MTRTKTVLLFDRGFFLSLFWSEDGESEITDAEIDELADEICTELGLLQIENLLTIANRAMERHPCMVMDKSHADAILRAKKRILRKISG